jgi:hypothetical protein
VVSLSNLLGAHRRSRAVQLGGSRPAPRSFRGLVAPYTRLPTLGTRFGVAMGAPDGHTDPMTDHYYQEDSQATTILVLGILGLVLCQVLGPFAWVMGNKELAGIDAGRRAPENRGTAQAGRILGIISTVLMVIGVGLLLVLLAVGVFAAAS